MEPDSVPYQRRVDMITGQPYLAVEHRGRELLLEPLTNKGTGFTREERDELGLNGLLPPNVFDMPEQLARAYENNRSQGSPLAQYVHLATLQDRNEVLFFRLLHEHVEELMPIVYTPTVGEACQRFSHIYRQARGIFVDWNQRGRIAEVLANSHVREASVIMVTDGERILGLGDQGVGGMGIPIGKLALYTLCAGLPSDTTVPVMLDLGTDNQELLADPLYHGLRRRRVRGDDYQAFVDEFVAAAAQVSCAAACARATRMRAFSTASSSACRKRCGSRSTCPSAPSAEGLAAARAAERNKSGAAYPHRPMPAGAPLPYFACGSALGARRGPHLRLATTTAR